MPTLLATQLLLRATRSSVFTRERWTLGPVSLAGGTQGRACSPGARSGRTDGAGGARKVPSTGGGVGSRTQKRETRATEPKGESTSAGGSQRWGCSGRPLGQGAEMSLSFPPQDDGKSRTGRLQDVANSGGGRSADRPPRPQVRTGLTTGNTLTAAATPDATFPSQAGDTARPCTRPHCRGQVLQAYGNWFGVKELRLGLLWALSKLWLLL